MIRVLLTFAFLLAAGPVLAQSLEEIAARQQSKLEEAMRRHARAADCSFKRTYLPEELQAVQKPLDHYLYPAIQEVQALKDEREELTRW